MGTYSSDPVWADVTPLPTDEGGPNPLAAIAYSSEYEECMSYLRAVMAANEFSTRVLTLTEDLIEMNPAHYTVWLYRAQCLLTLHADLTEELAWLNATALAHPKNYQIWHHRHTIVDALGSCAGETAFVDRMFAQDAKNYHVWSYRQWLVARFDLWEQGELEFTREMLERDVRNNSVWNHRWFVVNGREKEGVAGVDADAEVRAREVRFAQEAIRRAPKNQSPWNYLRAIVKKSGMPVEELRGFVEEFVLLGGAPGEEMVKSISALEFLVEILVSEKEGDWEGKAGQALDLLGGRYDPIRRNYWNYQKGVLGLITA
nr:protein farnesyltransferase/geranylgeranyltransferase type-1 subunit alpha [Quercus suber]